MKYPVFMLLLAGALGACADNSSGPVSLRPRLTQVNGAIEPTGTPGMTVFIEGVRLADAAKAQVYFQGEDGVPVAAAVSATESKRDGIVATVPPGTASSSFIWVVTPRGASDSIPFTLAVPADFDATAVRWRSTNPLPIAVNRVGATIIRMTRGAMRASNFVYVTGGGNWSQSATAGVYFARAEESGGVGQWITAGALPVSRSGHAMAAATGQNAPIDTSYAGYLYVIGGNDEYSRTLRDVYYAPVHLDGTVGSWSTTSVLPTDLHGASAVIFRGYVYLVGGANHLKQPRSASIRAQIMADGSLGPWTPVTPLPKATQMHSLVNSGAKLYLVGGDTGKVELWNSALTGTESRAVYEAIVDVRDGSVGEWIATSALSTGRAKHATVLAGQSLVVTSGLYSRESGAESESALITPTGTVGSWSAVRGTNTIESVVGFALVNAAAVTFTGSDGRAHVLVLGGGRLYNETSAPVVYY